MKTNLIYRSSTVVAGHVKSSAPLIILSVLFLFLPAFDVFITSKFSYWVLFIFKTTIGFSIAFMLMFRYLDELYDLVDNFQVEQKNIKSLFWIFKKKNLIVMLKLLIYLAPFAALSAYYFIKISSYIDDSANQFYLDLLDTAPSNIIDIIKPYLPTFIFKFSFVYSNEIYLLLSSLGFAVFLLSAGLTIVYIALKISMINVDRKYYQTIRENVKGQVNNNYQNDENDIFNNLKMELEQEMLQHDRNSQQVETNIINTKESDMLTTIKKGTTPPLVINF